MGRLTPRVHYAWVAGVAFLALVMASGFRSTTGVLLIPLHEEFAWSHETIGLAVSLNLLCFRLGAPFGRRSSSASGSGASWRPRSAPSPARRS